MLTVVAKAPGACGRAGAAAALLAAAVLAGCSGSTGGKHAAGPSPAPAVATGADPSVIARAPAPPLGADEIPACFVGGEPAAAAADERTDVFTVPPRPGRGTPRALPTRTPQVAAIAAAAAFPLYALAAPPAEFTPALLRESSVPAGGGRAVSLFVLQYRVPPQRGGGLLIILSAPPRGSAPPRDDLDDSLDAVRIAARLPGTPAAGDPLTDPGRALRSLGCPTHQRLDVTLDGQQRPADLVSWPGAPRILLLRIESDRGEVTLESGLLSRDALLQLPPRLTALQQSTAATALLQALFSGRAPATPTPRR